MCYEGQDYLRKEDLAEGKQPPIGSLYRPCNKAEFNPATELLATFLSVVSCSYWLPVF